MIALVATWTVLFILGPAMVDETSWRQLTPADQVTAATGWRSLLVQAGLGVGALGALVFTARSFFLAREGHIVDRYSKAVDQLSSDKIDVRLGGIFALERVMLDSSRDHESIVMLLSTYLNEHAPANHDSPEVWSPEVEWLEPPSLTRLSVITNWRPPADIRAALTVLARRPPQPERGRLDLSSTDLRGAKVPSGARLHGVSLSGADLRQAMLRQADLGDAVLAKADMRQAVLTEADLSDALLYSADLRKALLMGADLSRADLTNARLDDAHLEHVKLHGANLTGTVLHNTDLRAVSGLTAEQLSQAETNQGTQLPETLAATSPPMELDGGGD